MVSVETIIECQMKHEMMVTILIIKAVLVIDQVQSMDTHVVEVMKTQQIIELRHVEKATLLIVNNETILTQMTMMDVAQHDK